MLSVCIWHLWLLLQYTKAIKDAQAGAGENLTITEKEVAVISGLGTVRIKHTHALKTTYQAHEGFGKTLRKKSGFQQRKVIMLCLCSCNSSSSVVPNVIYLRT